MELSVYKGFHICEKGHSHKVKGLPCQDAANHLIGNGYAIAAVSDGHGGEKYFRSAVGSRSAVDVAIRCLQGFLEGDKESLIGVPEERRDEILKSLAEQIIISWQVEIEKNFAEHPLEQQEKDVCAKYDIPIDSFQAHFYGATLLYTCITPDYSFTSQIGDGACVYFFSEGDPEIPTCLEDSRLGFGVTTSMSDSSPIGNFHHHFLPVSEGLTKAVFLYTDGVVDSYERMSFLTDFNRRVLDEMNKDEKNAKNALADWLPKLSEQGSQDDVSIAGVYIYGESEGQKI